MTLYPNPVSNILTIDFDKEDTPQYDLKITNAFGQIVHNQTAINSETVQIDVQNWSKGLYFLTIQTTDGLKTQIFMKD